MGASIHTDTLNIFKNDWLMLSDFIDFFCGDFIGEGTKRTVYEFKLNKKLVVKIDRSNGEFYNVSEWDIWHNIKECHPKAAGFLAPCLNISNAGKILTKLRTTPIKKEQLLKKIPAFLGDTKIQNWGMLDKRIVCHDYANHFLYKNANVNLVKPEWWSDNFNGKIQ